MSQILNTSGFNVNADKQDTASKRFDEHAMVTKLCIKRRRLHVRPEFFDGIMHQISDAARLASGHDLVGPYNTPDQILGRIHFVRWINPGKANLLLLSYRKVNWGRVKTEAEQRGLLKVGKTRTEKGNS